MNKINFLIMVLWFSATPAENLVAQAKLENFELSITGSLIEKLEPGTRISIGTIGTSKESPCVTMSTSVESLPLYLPKKHFQNRYLRVSFYSHTLKATIFSMEVCSDLMDEVRPIKLKLDQPSPSLRTTSWWDTIRYKPSITKRMAYMDLPYWDSKIGKLVPAPKRPMLRVDNGDGKTTTIEMGDACMGSKWHANLSRDLAPGKDSKITYVVDYDSGGLFDDMSTRFEYDYRMGIDTD